MITALCDVEGYGSDSRITSLVNGREFWIVPDMNPDGGEYDIATGSYRSWRKNRQAQRRFVQCGHCGPLPARTSRHSRVSPSGS
jgi:hypothetical protein